MTITASTINIQDASSKLGIPEGEFRKLLTGIVKSPSTAKKISLDKFKMIAQSLQTHVTELQGSEQDTLLQTEDEPTTEQAQSSEIDPQLSELDQQPSELATTEEQSLELDQERTRIQLNINLNLQQQVLDLNKITSALALVAAEEGVRNFEQIYTHSLNAGVDRVLSQVAARTHQTIKELREVDNSDFLSQHGRSPITTNQQALDQVLELL